MRPCCDRLYRAEPAYPPRAGPCDPPPALPPGGGRVTYIRLSHGQRALLAFPLRFAAGNAPTPDAACGRKSRWLRLAPCQVAETSVFGRKVAGRRPCGRGSRRRACPGGWVCGMPLSAVKLLVTTVLAVRVGLCPLPREAADRAASGLAFARGSPGGTGLERGRRQRSRPPRSGPGAGARTRARAAELSGYRWLDLM